MSQCAEIVTYRITVAEEEFLRLRSAAITEVKAAHPALVAVPFAGRRADGSWADTWIYQSTEAAEKANADAANLPAFLSFFRVLDGVEIEVLEFPEAAASPIA